MKRYAVTWEDEVITICKTRADAEEYIFSEVEEIAYESFLESAHYYWEDDSNWKPEFFWRDLANENVRYHRPFKNLYAYILNRYKYGWYIQEVEELE